MMKVRIAVVTISALLATHDLCMAASYNLNGSVNKRTSAAGEWTYQFILFLRNINPTEGEDVQLELVSPAGVRFGERLHPAGDAVQILLEGVLPDEINDSVSGTWTIEETINNGSLNQYQFTVPEIMNSPKFPVAPTILSPVDGSTVGKVFDLIYGDPHPTRLGYSITFADPALQGNFPTQQVNAPGNITLSFSEIPGIGGERISRFSVINFEVFSHLLNPTPLNAGANSRFDELSLLAGNFSFGVHSPPISFTIVPEPASIFLLGLSIACVTGSRAIGRHPATHDARVVELGISDVDS